MININIGRSLNYHVPRFVNESFPKQYQGYKILTNQISTLQEANNGTFDYPNIDYQNPHLSKSSTYIT